MKSISAPTPPGRAHDGDGGPSATATPPAPVSPARASSDAHTQDVANHDPVPDSATAQSTDEAGVPDDRQEARERDRAEVAAAIAMVANHYAARVVLAGLRAPEAAVAALAMTAAARGVTLRLLTPTQDGNACVVTQRS